MNLFFGIPLAHNSLIAMTLALLLAVVLGAAIGLERELNGHPAGLRTHIMVALGSALITVVSVHMVDLAPGRADPARLAAQIVAGIGFLGAGTIMREGATVRGLTTAASIWTTAGIGIAVGTAPSFGTLAVIATVIALITLYSLHRADAWLDRRSRRVVVIDVTVHDSERAAARVIACVSMKGYEVCGLNVEPGREAHTRRLIVRVRSAGASDLPGLLSELAEEPGVHAAQVE